jgi:hypothetical protein
MKLASGGAADEADERAVLIQVPLAYLLPRLAFGEADTLSAVLAVRPD